MLIIDSTVYPISVVAGNINEQVVAGNYEMSNRAINRLNFTADQPHDADIVLCECDEDMGYAAALEDLDSKDLRPATMSELLALGAKHTELQRQFQIIALGSDWQYSAGLHRDVGYLFSEDGKRRLHLTWFGHVWRGARLAAVRK